jgi:hypothetical protein
MSRLALPIRGQILWSTGDIRLWVDLILLRKNNTGNWIPTRFRVDTATDITTFPAFRAKQAGFPMPQRPSRGAGHTQTGLEIRSGLLRFRIVGMDATEYAVPCFFLGDPNTPPSAPRSAVPSKLLQPFALLDHLRFHFDKNATVTAPYGEMVLEKK